MPTIRVGCDQSSSRIIAPVRLQLPPDQKLNLLRQLDRWRSWQSLDDRRLCLGCGHLISGHEIEVRDTGKDSGPLEMHCPTVDCQSIPLDWILPHPRDRELRV